MIGLHLARQTTSEGVFAQKARNQTLPYPELQTRAVQPSSYHSESYHRPRKATAGYDDPQKEGPKSPRIPSKTYAESERGCISPFSQNEPKKKRHSHPPCCKPTLALVASISRSKDWSNAKSWRMANGHSVWGWFYGPWIGES